MANGPKVTFKWEGIAELKRTIEQAGLSMDDRKPEVKQIILGPAEAMIRNAQQLAPISERGSIRTRTTKKRGTVRKKYPPGTLRRSLIATPGPANQRGIFLVARKKIAPYAVYVEFGTSKMPAQPFFRPALLQMASTYVDDIAPGIKQLVESTAAKNAYHPPK